MVLLTKRLEQALSIAPLPFFGGKSVLPEAWLRD